MNKKLFEVEGRKIWATSLEEAKELIEKIKEQLPQYAR